MKGTHPVHPPAEPGAAIGGEHCPLRRSRAPAAALSFHLDTFLLRGSSMAGCVPVVRAGPAPLSCPCPTLTRRSKTQRARGRAASSPDARGLVKSNELLV